MKNTGVGLVGLIGIINSEAENIAIDPKWKTCEDIKSKNPCGEVLMACYPNNCSSKINCPYYFRM